MSRQSPGRADDLRVLQILHVVDTDGTAVARARFGLSNGAVQGLRGRYLRGSDAIRCACERPENKDGGMAPRWWAQ